MFSVLWMLHLETLSELPEKYEESAIYIALMHI